MKKVCFGCMFVCLLLLSGCVKKPAVFPTEEQIKSDIQDNIPDEKRIDKMTFLSDEMIEKYSRYSVFYLLETEESENISFYSCHLLYDYSRLSNSWKLTYSFIEKKRDLMSGEKSVYDNSSERSLYNKEYFSMTSCVLLNTYNEQDSNYNNILYFTPGGVEECYVEYFLGGKYTNLTFSCFPSKKGWSSGWSNFYRRTNAKFSIVVTDEKGKILGRVDSIKRGSDEQQIDVDVTDVKFVSIKVIKTNHRTTRYFKCPIIVADAELVPIILSDQNDTDENE